MTLIYENRGYMKRQTLSAAVVVVVTLYGVWELSAGLTGTRSDGFLWGSLFLGGAVYAYIQLFNDARNKVARLERDDDGRMIATLWRPTGKLQLASEGNLTDWRYYIRVVGRRMRKPVFLARHPNHADPLEFEIRSDIKITDELRELAPEAIAEMEEATAKVGEAAT